MNIPDSVDESWNTKNRMALIFSRIGNLKQHKSIVDRNHTQSTNITQNSSIKTQSTSISINSLHNDTQREIFNDTENYERKDEIRESSK